MTPKRLRLRGFRLHLIELIVAGSACVGAARAQGPSIRDSLPQPRRFNDESCPKFSAPEFERLLLELKAEREALDAEGKTLTKRMAAEKAPSEHDQAADLQKLNEVLQRLKSERSKPAKITFPDPPLPPNKKDEPPLPMAKSTDDPSSVVFVADGAGPTVVNPLQLAQTLMRAEQYNEALTAFRKVDLKGKKAEERAPIQYLMATCLYYVGKNDEALTLLREVANSRGDEQAARYAQWQLDMLRWQRDVRDRIQDLRQRRVALEKR